MGRVGGWWVWSNFWSAHWRVRFAGGWPLRPPPRGRRRERPRASAYVGVVVHAKICIQTLSATSLDSTHPHPTLIRMFTPPEYGLIEPCEYGCPTLQLYAYGPSRVHCMTAWVHTCLHPHSVYSCTTTVVQSTLRYLNTHEVNTVPHNWPHTNDSNVKTIMMW